LLGGHLRLSRGSHGVLLLHSHGLRVHCHVLRLVMAGSQLLIMRHLLLRRLLRRGLMMRLLGCLLLGRRMLLEGQLLRHDRLRVRPLG
jgi:hypothetical protein